MDLTLKYQSDIIDLPMYNNALDLFKNVLDVLGSNFRLVIENVNTNSPINGVKLDNLIVKNFASFDSAAIFIDVYKTIRSADEILPIPVVEAINVIKLS